LGRLWDWLSGEIPGEPAPEAILKRVDMIVDEIVAQARQNQHFTHIDKLLHTDEEALRALAKAVGGEQVSARQWDALRATGLVGLKYTPEIYRNRIYARIFGLPSPDVRPVHITGGADWSPQQIHGPSATVWEYCDGRRDLPEIARLAGIGVEVVQQAVIKLRQLRLVKYDNASKRESKWKRWR
jgi:hypothetical protein